MSNNTRVASSKLRNLKDRGTSSSLQTRIQDFNTKYIRIKNCSSQKWKTKTQPNSKITMGLRVRTTNHGATLSHGNLNSSQSIKSSKCGSSPNGKSSPNRKSRHQSKVIFIPPNITKTFWRTCITRAEMEKFRSSRGTLIVTKSHTWSFASTYQHFTRKREERHSI